MNRVGLALVFPSADLVLPSLWEEAAGTSEVTVFVRDEEGRRVLTPELARIWTWHVRLAEERLACVGKHVRGRLALVSADALPALYAVTAPSREAGELSALERAIADALLEAGPSTAPELRRLLGAEARPVKRALERLQRALVVTRAGEAAQEHGWDAAVFDLVARRYGDRLRAVPEPEAARRQLVSIVLDATREVSAADVAAVLGLRRTEAAAALASLADDGRARRHDEGGVTLWRVRGRGRRGGPPGAATRPRPARP